MSNIKYRDYRYRLDFYFVFIVFQQDRLCCVQISLPFPSRILHGRIYGDEHHHNMPSIGRTEILFDTLCTRENSCCFFHVRYRSTFFVVPPKEHAYMPHSFRIFEFFFVCVALRPSRGQVVVLFFFFFRLYLFLKHNGQ